MKKLLTLIFIICPTIIWANVDFVLFRNDGTFLFLPKEQL